MTILSRSTSTALAVAVLAAVFGLSPTYRLLAREFLAKTLNSFGVNSADMASSSESGFYDLSATSISGEPFPFSKLKNSVVLIINVASECGYTDSSYKKLSFLFDKYSSQGLQIIAFPCNQFGDQEPDPDKEILSFVQSNYDVKFSLMSKVNVNGAAIHPVFKFLKEAFPGDISWNFHGIWLVDRSGMIKARFNSPSYDEIEANILQLLKG